MLNRSCPRAIALASIAYGKTSESLPFVLPVYSKVSSCRCPRATVPATIGRAERSSVKNVDSRSGMNFGWSCMSCRQAVVEPPPDTAATKNTKTRKRGRALCTKTLFAGFVVSCVSCCLVRNGRHLSRIERFQESSRPFQIELRVGRLYTEKKSIAAREREPRNVEHRVIGLRQAVEREHAED